MCGLGDRVKWGGGGGGCWDSKPRGGMGPRPPNNDANG